MANEVVLTPRNLVFPVARMLDSKILQDYKESIGKYNEKARNVLDIFSDINGILAGSNCFAPIQLRNLLPKDSRLATMADLGLATEINPGFLQGFYSDTGLVLRTNGDSYSPNDFLAKDLAGQLKKRGITLNNSKVLYFDAFDLRQDENSPCGLAYNLREDAELGKQIIDAPELTCDFSFVTMDKRGIPIRDNSGNRHFYAKKDGLSGFCLGGYSELYSNYRGGGLVVSGGGNRVVVVSAENAGENFLGPK